MKITKVTPRLIEREMAGNLWNPRTRWARKQIVLVFVETADGLCGVGEGWTSSGSPRALIATIEDDLAPLLIGQDPHFVTRLLLVERSTRGRIAAKRLLARRPASARSPTPPSFLS
jgi:L-alanine-DL-glutamate epimerase-like enolase superfamily enzyme